MATKEEYKHVLTDLLQVKIFTGIYDAEHGDEHLMYGINTVMAYIANQVSKDTCDNVEDLFFTNLIASQHGEKLPKEEVEAIHGLVALKRTLSKFVKKICAILLFAKFPSWMYNLRELR